MNLSTGPSPRVVAAVQVLRDRGERVTRARHAVLSVLDGSPQHLDADEVATRAEAVAPGVHRATVYRALSTLGELGVITHTHIGGSGTVYHLVVPDEAGSHVHLRCTECREVFDLSATALAPLLREAEDTLGFRIDPAHTALLGVCSRCRG